MELDARITSVGGERLKVVPMSPYHAASPRTSKPAKGKSKRSSGNEPELEPSVARVLVVDDHLDARLLLEEYLQENGFYVSVAKNGAEALALLRGGIEFDLVVLDINMPHVDGYGFLDALKKMPQGVRNLPVVVLSGYAPKKVRGVVAQLDKPAPLDAVLAAIQRSLRKH